MVTTSSLLDPLFLKKLASLNLVSKRVFAGQIKGERRSAKRGSSVEFADYREYTAGDDLRYVDWKAYGRLEKLFVKLFTEEEDLNLHILIDTSRSMDFGSPLTKSDYARRVAAALGYIALSEYDRVHVVGFSTTLGDVMPPARGTAGIGRFLNFLETKLAPSDGTQFGTALSRYAAVAKNVGIAVVISDFFDESYKVGLKALFARRYQVVLLHVLDEEEMNPSLTGDLRLLDAETSESREVSMSPYVLEQYQTRLKSFCDEIQTLAASHNADYIRTSTSVPFETVVLQFLRSRGLLR